MTNLPRMAGLRRDYRGTCVVCLIPTDTGLGFRGVAEWCVAGLERLGVPAKEAHATIAHTYGDGVFVPDGVIEMPVRVCRACVRRNAPNFPDPALALPGAPMPTICQPPAPRDLP